LSSLVTGAVALSCGRDAPPPAPVRPPPPKPPMAVVDAGAVKPPMPEWTYWEAIDVRVTGDVDAPDLPLAEPPIVRLGGAGARALKDAIVKGGFAGAAGAGDRARLGAFYEKLRDDKTPFVVTMDALFFLTHLAFERALAEVETQVIAPSLETILKRLDARLTA